MNKAYWQGAMIVLWIAVVTRADWLVLIGVALFATLMGAWFWSIERLEDEQTIAWFANLVKEDSEIANFVRGLDRSEDK